MATRRTILASALVVGLAVGGCTGSPAAKKTTPAKITSQLAGGPVVGLILAPAGIIAQGGGNIVTNTSANIVAQGGGNLVGNSGGTYRLEAVEAHALAAVTVELVDANLQPLPGVAPVKTDAAGHYTLPAVPPGTYLVLAGTQTADKRPAPLLTVIKVSAAGATADVGMATTFLTVALTEGVGGLTDVDPVAFKRAADATARSLTDADIAALADRATMLARMEALAKEVAEVKEGLAAVGRQIADLQAQLADLQKRLNTPAATGTAGPFVAPTKVLAYAEGIGDGTSPVVDSDGKLYLADPAGHSIRAVGTDGAVTSVAGLVPPKTPYVDDVVAKATLNTPTGIGIEVGPHHSFFIADSANHVLRGLDLDADGGARLVTAAGTGKEGTNDEGDPGPATLRRPYGVAIARDGTVFVTDAAAGSLRYMQMGKLRTATLTGAAPTSPMAVAVGADNRLYIIDGARVLRLVPQGGMKYTVDELGGPYTAPAGLAVAPNGSVLVAEGSAHRLRVVDAATGKTTFTFGGAAIDGATRTEAAFGELTGVAAGSGGAIFVTDKTNHRVWKLLR
ncbi:MAG: repeat protein [Cyanobacteria bacterium RYN_339]|nr:repeat protein [Cyanobacteria bacterium RYN_339]